MSFPSNIICLTEESVETLYLLGRSELIQGISQYVERPLGANLAHPQVTQFIRSDIDKIVSLRPDLIIGFSDLQKDIASDLIGRGLNVLVTNQRTLDDILNSILMLGRIVNEGEKARLLVESFKQKLDSIKEKGKKLGKKPKVYFEEWDHPRISGITWVSELIEVCGGENIFKSKAGSMAQARIVSDEEIIEANPDIIFGCWCGKSVKVEAIASRPKYDQIKAVQNKQIWELPPAIFLQPGPALFVDGLDQMFTYFQQFSRP